MAKKAKKKLTFDQRMKILLTPCKTRKEMRAWIKYHLSLELPDCTVSRYANTNPEGVVWELYKILVLKKNPENIEELLCVAGRGSGKCSEKGTLILEGHSIKKIENIKPGELVYTGWDWQPVIEHFDEGIKDAIEIKTRLLSKSTPSSIVGSYKHRIQVIKEDGSVDWEYLPNIKEDQYIYKSTGNNSAFSIGGGLYDEGWLVGAILGDGSVSRHGNNIDFCSSDFECLRFYSNIIFEKFGIKCKVKRNSKKSAVLRFANKDFRLWLKQHIKGELAYDKQLVTLEHDVSFLAGVISGLMDTDGSKDSITLANKELIYQIGKMLNVFGVACGINDHRRPPSISKFTKNVVTYHECTFKTKLPDFLLPRFSKRNDFILFRDNMNEQFRYPNKLVEPFVDFIKNELKASNGWITINGDRIRKSMPYAKELFGNLKHTQTYIYRHKLIDLRKFFEELELFDQVKKLDFILSGYYEQVSEILPRQAYFYDLEVNDTHSYWSNGFISHNTLGMAVLELLVILHDKRDTVHVGAIQTQAERCYLYIKNFMYNSKLKDLMMPPKVPEDERLLEKSNMSKSYFNVDKVKVSLEVLPCTLKACNGPHVPLVVVDEIDTVSGEGLKAFKEISGMLDSRPGQKSLRVGISTRKSRYGLMNQQIENAEAEGRHVRKWTAFEFLERCPDSRSGKDPVDLYVIQDKMEAIVEEEFNKKAPQKQREYTKHTMPGSGCITCPIASVCLGDAKNQISKSPMLKPISDITKKVLAEGADWTLAQLMNLKPSVEGIIFREFDEKLHVKNWNQMWMLLTGKEFPGECTHDVFVTKCHQMRLPCYAGVDWGWSNPNTVVYFFMDKKDNIYIVRTDGMTYTSQPSWIHHMRTKYHNMYRCQLYFPDVADMGAVQEMKKAGLPVANEVDKNINTGVQVIKKMLRTPGSQEPKLFICEEFGGNIINEFLLYHFKLDTAGMVTDTPEEKNDHWLDALRYPLSMLLGKSTLIMAGDSGEYNASTMTSDNKYRRTPSAAEFAESQGIGFNDEDDRSKVGKIGKKSEVEDDDGDDDGGIGGEGGFLWSF